MQRFSVVDAQVSISPVEIGIDHDLAFNRTHITGFDVYLETGNTVAVDWKEIAILRRQLLLVPAPGGGPLALQVEAPLL